MAASKENKTESVKANASVVETPTVVENVSTVLETKKVRFLLSPCGAYFLPYNVGQEVDLPANQADELVESKYAEYVK